MYLIRRLSKVDIACAVPLTETMNWHMSEEDFKFMLKIEPEGCFVAVDDSRIVGITTTISYGRVGWIGNVIVSKKYRKRHIGSELIKHSLQYLSSKSVETIGLFSYVDQTAFYEKLGFIPAILFTVLKRKSLKRSPFMNIEKPSNETLRKILSLDELCFKASREKLLKPISLKPENICFFEFNDRDLLGFVFVKMYSDMAEIGPLVCKRGLNSVAEKVLKKAAKATEHTDTYVYVSDSQNNILKALCDLGFTREYNVVEMFYGRPVEIDCIYMAESLERG